MKVGDFVIYVDSRGNERDALITAIWGDPDNNPAINVVVVNESEDQRDNYGRKIERFTSVVYASSQPAHGNYWKHN